MQGTRTGNDAYLPFRCWFYTFLKRYGTTAAANIDQPQSTQGTLATGRRSLCDREDVQATAYRIVPRLAAHHVRWPEETPREPARDVVGRCLELGRAVV